MTRIKKNKSCYLALFLLIFISIAGCGGIHYTETAPGAVDFKPTSIGVLPVDVGANMLASSAVDEMLSEALKKSGEYSLVLSADKIKEGIVSDKTLQKSVSDYLQKLRTVHYSDPGLSMLIGEGYGIDAFMVVTVDFWNYTVEGGDKVAKVGFGMILVDADSGEILWKASHYDVEDYLIIKPDLTELAEDVMSKMLTFMPH